MIISTGLPIRIDSVSLKRGKRKESRLTPLFTYLLGAFLNCINLAPYGNNLQKALKGSLLESQPPAVGIRAKEMRNGCDWGEQAEKPAQMARNLQTLLCRAVNQV